MIYKNLVFGKTKDIAMNYLEGKINELEDKDIKYIKRNREEFIVELVDGSIYQVVSATQGERGYKGHRVYVDITIDFEILDYVIKPTLLYSDIPEEDRIIYF